MEMTSRIRMPATLNPSLDGLTRIQYTTLEYLYLDLDRQLDSCERWIRLNVDVYLIERKPRKVLERVSELRKMIKIVQDHLRAWGLEPTEYITFLDIVEQHFSDELKTFLVTETLNGNWNPTP